MIVFRMHILTFQMNHHLYHSHHLYHLHLALSHLHGLSQPHLSLHKHFQKHRVGGNPLRMPWGPTMGPSILQLSMRGEQLKHYNGGAY